ncbi:MAG: nitrile hydratase subunit beta [Deltaproteobacteria bacterium]|nr:nitrile hydratase subunit beta [Deltaproteobacteria bacterium]
MDGIHDMGGMEGFGRVQPELNEPTFHADWERRVLAIFSGVLTLTGRNMDEFRHAIERIPPARYLTSSYYERWLLAAETVLVERAIITGEELKSLAQPEHISVALPAVSPKAAPAKARLRARFKVGDRVQVRNIHPSGHTRAPRYVRGKTGVVRRVHGIYVFPDTNAHRAGENRQHVYLVEFSARALWGLSDRGRLMIDLWEDYLEPVDRSKTAIAKRNSVAARRKSRAKKTRTALPAGARQPKTASKSSVSKTHRQEKRRRR